MKPKISSVYKHFKLLSGNQNNTNQRYNCRYCDSSYKRNCTRMRKHITKCKKCPAEIQAFHQQYLKAKGNNSKIEYESDALDFSDMEDEVSEVRATTTSNASITTTSSALEKSESISMSTDANSTTNSTSQTHLKKITNYLDLMSDDEKKKNWVLLARACYVSGTPFSFVENPYWKEFFKRLRPSFKLPSRATLSNSLLEKEYAEVTKNVEEKLESAESLSIQMDGWTNIKRDPIVNIVIQTQQGPIIYKIIETRENHQTGKYLSTLIIDTMKEVSPEKFTAFVTDNAKCMLKCQKVVQEAFPNQVVAGYGCVAHILNLLIKDINKILIIKIVTFACIAMIKKIRKCNIFHELFQMEKENSNKPSSISLKLPGKTRWGSIVITLGAFIANKDRIKGLIIMEEASEFIDDEFRKNVLDPDFWTKIQAIYSLLNPINKSIMRVQSDFSSISEVVNEFVLIEGHLKMCKNNLKDCFKSATLYNEILKLFEKRRRMALQPIHFAAHILNPSEKGKRLSDDEDGKGVDFLISFAKSKQLNEVDVLADLANYKSASEKFAKPYLWTALKKKSDGTVLDPIDWWIGLNSSSKLSSIAACILRCPPTTAATERSFKSFSITQTKTRNRLTNKRAAKVVYVRHNLISTGKYSKSKRIKKKLLSAYHADVVANVENSQNENPEQDVANLDQMVMDIDSTSDSESEQEHSEAEDQPQSSSELSDYLSEIDLEDSDFDF